MFQRRHIEICLGTFPTMCLHAYAADVLHLRLSGYTKSGNDFARNHSHACAADTL